MKRFALVAIALLFLATGCVTVPLAPPDVDRQVKMFQPTQETAGLYLVRTDRGAPVVFHLSVDGLTLGPLAPRTYFWLPLPPGQHTIVASSPENSVRERVNLLPGQMAFVAVHPRFGHMANRVGLQPMDPAQGKKALAKSRLAQRVDD